MPEKITMLVEPNENTVHKCSRCGCDQNGGDFQSWELAEVIDFKKKVATFTGFPSGETHTIKGWRIKGLGHYS